MAEQYMESEPLDYEEDDEPQVPPESAPAPPKKDVKGSYMSIHSSGFRDFLLKPEVLRALVNCGFEHRSEVQQEYIPQAILGVDVLCQAKSGMGKMVVFVLPTLQQMELVSGQVGTGCGRLRWSRGLGQGGALSRAVLFPGDCPGHVSVSFGGLSIKKDEAVLKKRPHVVVGTPGSILALARSRSLSLRGLRNFVLDERDKMLEQPGCLPGSRSTPCRGCSARPGSA
ncbi:ATP-dependent RNA helicase DDX39A [Lepus europaeus]|uniref:ATP-dependent RNA helicase DDX39A n=1 Tax=Lepus europaeus TaxID=9983 RepID=UPI002B48BF15|nr:ATP-dependent RNA helicase DDX39A [Lepus europaeus]